MHDYQELQFLIFPYVYNVVTKNVNSDKKLYKYFAHTFQSMSKQSLDSSDMNSLANVLHGINFELLNKQNNTERERLILKYTEKFFEYIKNDHGFEVKVDDDVDLEF